MDGIPSFSSLKQLGLVPKTSQKTPPFHPSTAMFKAMKMMYEAGGDMCQKEAKEVKCPTFILLLDVTSKVRRCGYCVGSLIGIRRWTELFKPLPSCKLT